MRRPLSRLLVANRGEVVSRVARTARARGITVIGVFAESDGDAVYLRDVDLAVSLGDDRASTPYLDIGALLDAARQARADAVHPGYGFLAESPEFAQRCIDAGLTWVGPPPAAITAMGGKIGAKELAAAAGVPVLPSLMVDERTDVADIAALGFPLLLKPSAGGGGKGMHLVESAGELPGAVSAARREAVASFGDSALLAERYVARPRHVEVQVFADEAGNVLHLGDRDCSVQRRHQKIIEEAPAPLLDSTLRAGMAEAAVALARAIGYVGAGTVEYLAFDSGFAFLEMNTRLQVEHAVTEEVTGLDLVDLQLHVAAGGQLPFTQADVQLSGHAVEARLYAEDPTNDFLPTPGVVQRLQVPTVPGVRWELGLDTGTCVGARYDPMVAKIVAHGTDRDRALSRLQAGLQGLRTIGLTTNRTCLVDITADPEFRDGGVGTDYLARRPDLLAGTVDDGLVRFHAVAAALHASVLRRHEAPLQPFTPPGWRNFRSQDQLATLTHERCGNVTVAYRHQTEDGWSVAVDGADGRARVRSWSPEIIDLELDGARRSCRVLQDGGATFVDSPEGTTAFRSKADDDSDAGAVSAGAALAPMPGTVVAVNVAPGDAVADGDTLLVLEAMKMEHRVRATGAGFVAAVHVRVGDAVTHQQLLVDVDEPRDA